MLYILIGYSSSIIVMKIKVSVHLPLFSKILIFKHHFFYPAVKKHTFKCYYHLFFAEMLLFDAKSVSNHRECIDNVMNFGQKNVERFS